MLEFLILYLLLLFLQIIKQSWQGLSLKLQVYLVTDELTFHYCQNVHRNMLLFLIAKAEMKSFLRVTFLYIRLKYAFFFHLFRVSDDYLPCLIFLATRIHLVKLYLHITEMLDYVAFFSSISHLENEHVVYSWDKILELLGSSQINS